jgi:hypothetical protein
MNKQEMKQKKAQKEAKLETKKADIKGAAVKTAKLIALLLVPAFIAVGCATQPSRSQTQTFKDCHFYVLAAPPAACTNAVAMTGARPLGVGDILSQNMMIETGGNENNTASSTPTTTTPIDLSYGGTSGVDSLLGATADRIKGTAKKDKAKPAAKETSGCSDGSCEIQ